MEATEERPAKMRRIEDSSDTALNESPSSPQTESRLQNGLGEPSLSHAEENISQQGEPQLSKNQRKKIRKKLEWDAGKEWRKAKRKEKNKARKAVRKATEEEEVRKQLEENGEEVTEEAIEAAISMHHQLRWQAPKVQVPITLLIDCDFDELMTEKEITSLCSQLSRSYSDNRKAPFKTHLVISSFRGQLKNRMETVLKNYHVNWKGVTFTEDDFVEAAKKAEVFMRGPEGGELAGALLPSGGEDGEEPGSSTALEQQETETQDLVEPSIDPTDTAVTDTEWSHSQPPVVYLTSDSKYTLKTLCPYTTYIIGGIVDKNRHKGICYQRAMDRNIATAKLPIGQFMEMQSRTVLATNHVVEIMLRWLEDGDWGKAFLRVIPKRKEAKLRVKAGDGLENGEPGTEDEAEVEELCS